MMAVNHGRRCVAEQYSDMGIGHTLFQGVAAKVGGIRWPTVAGPTRV